jgi:hypothetical protein
MYTAKTKVGMRILQIDAAAVRHGGDVSLDPPSPALYHSFPLGRHEEIAQDTQKETCSMDSSSKVKRRVI